MRDHATLKRVTRTNWKKTHGGTNENGTKNTKVHGNGSIDSSVSSCSAVTGRIPSFCLYASMRHTPVLVQGQHSSTRSFNNSKQLRMAKEASLLLQPSAPAATALRRHVLTLFRASQYPGDIRCRVGVITHSPLEGSPGSWQAPPPWRDAYEKNRKYPPRGSTINCGFERVRIGRVSQLDLSAVQNAHRTQELQKKEPPRTSTANAPHAISTENAPLTISSENA